MLHIYIYISYFSSARVFTICTSVLQELAQKLKSDLGRPSCMNADAFIHPDTQCPKKQRGRKKKQSNTQTPSNTEPEVAKDQGHGEVEPRKRKGKTALPTGAQNSSSDRPSAAACGFSTEGMTDAEVRNKLQGLQKAIEQDTCQVEPKKRRGRKASATRATSSNPLAAASGAELDDKPKGNMPAESTVEVKVKRKRARKGDKPGDAQLPETDNETSTKVTKVAKVNKSADAAGSMDPNPAKRKRAPRSSKAGNYEGAVETPTTSKKGRRNAKKTLDGTTAAAEHRTEVASTQDGTEHGAPNTTPSVEDAVEVASTTATAGMDEAEEAAASRRAEAKQKVSRKSSAYHKAVLQAKKDGKTKEEQKAAGKAATWTAYPPCVLFMSPN
jgi:hypothetical protein